MWGKMAVLLMDIYLSNTDYIVEKLEEAEEKLVMYDVIITDIIMPEGDGFEVVLDLRHMGMSDRTIAISGGGRTSAEDYLATAQHFDVAAIFSKPLDLQLLRNKVDEIIKAHS